MVSHVKRVKLAAFNSRRLRKNGESESEREEAKAEEETTETRQDQLRQNSNTEQPQCRYVMHSSHDRGLGSNPKKVLKSRGKPNKTHWGTCHHEDSRLHHDKTDPWGHENCVLLITTSSVK